MNALSIILFSLLFLVIDEFIELNIENISYKRMTFVFSISMKKKKQEWL